MMRNLHAKQLLLAIFGIILFGCSENPGVIQLPDDDVDAVAAQQLTADYFNETGARSSAGYAIIVLKYEEDKLMYLSSDHPEMDYQEVNEETITASVDEGGFVFWYAGGGVSDLLGIEFDKESSKSLQGKPEGWYYEKLWLIQVKKNTKSEHLKYDIIYKYFDEDGESELIRLDPKVRINTPTE